MATATEVISSLKARGVTFQLETAGGLRVNGTSRLTDPEKAVLRAHKASILKLLRQTHPPPPPAVAGSTVVTAAVANRQSMPVVAAAVDQLRAIFGPVQVVYASEGGQELGREPPPGVIARPPHIPNKSGKRGRP